MTSLSLIIPNYNNADYLDECMESVLNQVRIPDEVVIIDDASTDHSVEKIKMYEQKYPFVRGIYNDRNRGVAYSRHYAIVQSKGEYITMLDSDDFFSDPHKLKNEMELIEKWKKEHNEDIIAFSNFALYNPKSGECAPVYLHNYEVPSGGIFFEVITRSKPIPRDFVMKRECYFDVGGFDTTLAIYEDWDLNIRLASKYKFYYTQGMGTAYRVHGSGLSAADYLTHILTIRDVFRKYEHLFADAGEKKRAAKKITNYLIRMFLNRCGLNDRERSVLTGLLRDAGLLPLRRARRIENKLRSLKNNGTVLIYGAGQHTEMLLSLFDFRDISVAGIVDQNVKLHASTLMGYSIYPPQMIRELRPDAVIVSSHKHQSQIVRYLKDELKYKGTIVRLYRTNDDQPFYVV